MSNKEFERLQNRLDRPFGMWNCKHMWWPILLGVSQPTHTEEELRAYAENSNELITIDGATKTRYQWTQEQRRLETAIRHQKDAANLYKASGDTVGRREAQATINALRERYARVSEAAGLREDVSRASVIGFRQVKEWNTLSHKERFKNAEFATAKALATHAKKHIAEYGDITIDEYIKIARGLLQSPPSDDIMVLTRSDGSVSKYRMSTNDFVASDEQNHIRTAFKPKNGLSYWRGELERNK